MTEWNDTFSVGNETMDNIHREFLELGHMTAKAEPKAFEAAYKELMRHTKEHFFYENSQIDICRPASGAEHKAEHEQVLQEMEYFFSKAVQGRRSFARAYVAQKLPDWLRQHTATMDSDLSRAISATN